jgi:hypothetical protein
MALLIKHWKKTAFAALAAFTLWTLYFRPVQKTCAVFLDYDEAVRLCADEYPINDFWERAKTMGTAGALLRAQSLASRIAEGDVLRYTNGEIEKMKATKVAAQSAPLTPQTLWPRRPGVLNRIKEAARAHDLELKIQEFEGQPVAILGDKRSPEKFSLGFDPERIAVLRRFELSPLLSADDDPQVLLSKGANAVSLLSPAYAGDGDAARIQAALSGRHWLAFSDGSALGRMSRRARASFMRRIALPREKYLAAGDVRLSEGAAGFLRAAPGRSVLIARLDAGGGVEGNLAELRAALRCLRREGYAPSLAAAPNSGTRTSGAGWLVRFVLGFLLTVAGPIAALRRGVAVLRRMQVGGKLPEASPFREALAASFATLLTGLVVGAAAYAVLSVAVWRLDATVLSLSPWSGVLTFILSWLALYDPDPKALSSFFRKPVGKTPEYMIAVPAAITVLLLVSPDWLKEYGPGAWLALAATADESLWWVAPRWQEWLVGYPALFAGFCLYFTRLNLISRGCKNLPDPRGWLLVGLFAPVGLAQTLSSVRLDFPSLAVQTLQGAVVGIFIGLGLLALREKMFKKPDRKD